MVIAQRGTTALTVNNSEQFPVDRTNVRCGASGLSATTQQSTSVVPSNFRNSIAINVTTGAASGSTDRGYMLQKIEGVNVADFLLGTASAVTWTFSFWVRSSLTGTFSGSFQNSDQNRSYVFTYTINAANTWEQKSITVTGDTTGTWITGTGSGLFVLLDCGNGSSLRSSTTGSWIVGDFRGATGSTSLFANSGATFYTTGWQLEIGTVATSFDYRPYGTELLLCQRYFYSMGGNSTYEHFSLVSTTGSTDGRGMSFMPVPMRTIPSIGQTGEFQVVAGANAINGTFSAGTTMYYSISSFGGIQNIGFDFWPGTAGSYTNLNGACYVVRANNSTSTRVTFSAEL
jgi:hypothetical protein